MLRKALVSLALGLMITAVALAETQTVVLKDGRRIAGEVVETERGYDIHTRLGVVQVGRHEVKEIIVERTPLDEFNDRFAALEADDADGHLALGQWAVEQRLFEQAVGQFEYVLTLRPDDDRAALLLRDAQNKLDEANQPEPVEPVGPVEPVDDVTPGDGGGDAIDSPPGIDPDSLVTLQQIYRIRLAELRLSEIPGLRFRFTDDVEDRFASLWEGRRDFDPDDFDRLDKYEKLEFILEEIGDSERYNDIRDDIQITEDPQFMVDFRRSIWRLMRQPGGCAELTAHGGVEAHGGPRFLNPMSLSPGDPITLRVMYTNFLILDGYETPNGLKLIDRDQPEESLLLQYGLPPELAKYKHPMVGERPIQPIFEDKEDPDYVAVLTWIRDTLRGPVHPAYRVSFQLPGSAHDVDADDEVEDATPDEAVDDASAEPPAEIEDDSDADQDEDAGDAEAAP